MTDPSRDLEAGNRIGGYILEVRLGGGSFGSVWRARDASTGQLVAIKLLTGVLVTRDRADLRAEVELLAAAASSKSPHVVRVLGGGTEPLPYVVMEYIEGTDLAALLREQGKLSAEDTIRAGLAVADALRVLNEVGIIHRDVKPANIMLDNEGTVKLTDFGIAKIIGYETITMAGQLPMTMAYAAPEVWEGSYSHQSDLYALGIVLYQCLVGAPPFSGNYGVLYRQHASQAPDLQALPEETPPSLRELIRLCLEKDPEARPHDASECLKLQQQAEMELKGRAEEAAISTTVSEIPPARSRELTAQKRPLYRFVLLGALAVIILAVAGASALYAFGKGRGAHQVAGIPGTPTVQAAGAAISPITPTVVATATPIPIPATTDELAAAAKAFVTAKGYIPNYVATTDDGSGGRLLAVASTCSEVLNGNHANCSVTYFFLEDTYLGSDTLFVYAGYEAVRPIASGQFAIDYETYAQGDAMCCPSVTGTVTYTWTGEGFSASGEPPLPFGEPISQATLPLGEHAKLASQSGPLYVEIYGKPGDFHFTSTPGLDSDELFVPAGIPMTIYLLVEDSTDSPHAIEIPALSFRSPDGTGLQNAPTSFQITFSTPGVYAFDCPYHPGQEHGVIQVVPWLMR